MDINTFVEYAPIIIVIVCFLLKERIFVTPEQLVKLHAEILRQVDDKFVTKDTLVQIQSSMCDIKDKVDKLYDHLLNIHN